MNDNVFLNISRIIERESKSTTYKFALLRGIIDIIGDNSPYIVLADDNAEVPLGLMIEKWLLYYYPIFDAGFSIPQINGESKLAFQSELTVLVNYYKSRGGLSVFYNEMRIRGISKEIEVEFLNLIHKLKNTIVNKPMKYIGSSISNIYYSIFSYSPTKVAITRSPINLTKIIDSYGQFSIPREYYEAFKLLGSFISGTDSILFKWTDFSVNASGNTLSREKVISEVFKNPITDRDVLDVKKLYKSILQKSGKIECVWTGARVTAYDIDHVIPFSIWKNNDLWNLLPAQSTVNNQKRHKIPSSDILNKRKDSIINYWDVLKSYQEERFFSEIRVSLLGKSDSEPNWQNFAFQQLKKTSEYLINTRGHEAWQL